MGEYFCDLKRLIARRQVVVVVGTGVSLAVSGEADVATWRGLLDAGVERCEKIFGEGLPEGWGKRRREDIRTGDISLLLSVAQDLTDRLRARGGGDWRKWLRDTVGQLRVTDPRLLQAIGELGALMTTTNYDTLIEQVSGKTWVTLSDPGRVQRVLRGDEDAVVHLHGCCEEPGTIVFGASSYQRLVDDKAARAILRSLLIERSLLFIGCGEGVKDPNFAKLLEWMRTYLGGSEYDHYRLALADEVEALSELHANDRVVVLSYGNRHSELVPFLRSLTPPDGDPPLEDELPREEALMHHYLSGVRRRCNRVPIAGLGSDALAVGHRGLSLTLDQVFVSLDTLTSRFVDSGGVGSPMHNEGEDQERQRISALEAIAQTRERRAVLLGAPGAGKSTLVRYLALGLAEARLFPEVELEAMLPGWPGGPRVPVIVSLSRLAERLTGEDSVADAVRGFMAEELAHQPRLQGFEHVLDDVLRREGGVVLFDSLDEVADMSKRTWVRRAIEAFLEDHPSCFAVLTCRTYSYHRDSGWGFGWPVYELAPLSRSKVEEFIDAWYSGTQHLEPARAEELVRKRRSFLQAILSSFERAESLGDPSGLHQLAANPLLLSVMAAIHYLQGELPNARVQVYKECVDLLLSRWERVRLQNATGEGKILLDSLGMSDTELHVLLREVAYKSYLEASRARMGGATNLTAVPEELLLGVLATRLQRDWRRVQDFLSYCEEGKGVLVLQGRIAGGDRAAATLSYAFPHRTIQEYLTSLYLSDLDNLGPLVRSHLEYGEEWREVIVLLGEYLCFERRDCTRLEAILRSLVPAQEPRSQGRAASLAVWLAGDLLVIIRRAGIAPDLESGLADRVAERLVMLLESEGTLDPKGRAAVGRTLACLGDPRRGIGVYASGAGDGQPKFRWGGIPAGNLAMGVDDRSSFKVPSGTSKPLATELGPPGNRKTVKIAPFLLAAYPVTVAQYRPFVDSGGYLERRFWTSGGWEWRVKNHIVSPGEWFDLLPDHENQPVTHVSWYEAVAYCRWLTEVSREVGLIDVGETVRLPTEAEWEWAARGRERLRWPWGDEWRDGACNSAEAEIHAITAVGAFPSGVNWTQNVWDLAGNVSEWCSTCWRRSLGAKAPTAEWTPDDLDDESVSSARVLRGSYSGIEAPASAVRGSFRYGGVVGYRLGNRAFRCAMTVETEDWARHVDPPKIAGMSRSPR